MGCILIQPALNVISNSLKFLFTPLTPFASSTGSFSKCSKFSFSSYKSYRSYSWTFFLTIWSSLAFIWYSNSLVLKSSALFCILFAYICRFYLTLLIVFCSSSTFFSAAFVSFIFDSIDCIIIFLQSSVVVLRRAFHSPSTTLWILDR